MRQIRDFAKLFKPLIGVKRELDLKRHGVPAGGHAHISVFEAGALGRLRQPVGFDGGFPVVPHPFLGREGFDRPAQLRLPDFVLASGFERFTG